MYRLEFRGKLKIIQFPSFAMIALLENRFREGCWNFCGENRICLSSTPPVESKTLNMFSEGDKNQRMLEFVPFL